MPGATHLPGESTQIMAKAGKNKPEDSKPPEKPDWADGLKRLYDSVVEEPLPDAIRELLDRLDGEDA